MICWNVHCSFHHCSQSLGRLYSTTFMCRRVLSMQPECRETSTDLKIEVLSSLACVCVGEHVGRVHAAGPAFCGWRCLDARSQRIRTCAVASFFPSHHTRPCVPNPLLATRPLDIHSQPPHPTSNNDNDVLHTTLYHQHLADPCRAQRLAVSQQYPIGLRRHVLRICRRYPRTPSPLSATSRDRIPARH